MAGTLSTLWTGLAHARVLDPVVIPSPSGRELQTPHDLARAGEVEALRARLERNVELVEWPNGSGQSPLHVAARFGQVECARLLLEYDAVIDARDANEQTPLHLCGVCGQTAAARFLLEQGAEPAPRDRAGNTPLSQAAFFAHEALVEELLARGVEYDPLAAVHRGDVDRLRALLDADPALRDWERLLMESARHGETSLVTLLLARGADPNAGHGHFQIPVVNYGLHSVPVLRLLVEAGARIDYEVRMNGLPFGGTLLHAAAFRDLLPTVEFLLAEGLDPAARADDGTSSLHHAASRSTAAMVEVLIAAGAELEAKERSGATALHHAAARGRVETIRALLEHGADADARDAENRRPVDCITLEGDTDGARQLLQRSR